jgi:hypothetical protein
VIARYEGHIAQYLVLGWHNDAASVRSLPGAGSSALGSRKLAAQ